MRYLYILIISILTSCSSVPKEYLAQEDICKYDDSIFKISENELFLNSDILKELENKTEDLILLDNHNYEKLIYNLNSGQKTYRQINKHLNIVKLLRYRKDGTIKYGKITYGKGSNKIFKETHYNDQGNVTKVIDYEKGYNICWSEAIEIVKKIAKKDIEKYQVIGFNLTHTNLNEFPNVKPEWQVSLNGNDEYKLKPFKFYHIDGVTGKLLKTTTATMVP